MTAVTSFSTAGRIITYAYQDAGLIQEGETPNSEQLASGTNRLNDIINLTQTQGLKLWALLDKSIPLVADQATYQLGPSYGVDMTKPLRVIQAYYLDSDNNKWPLIPLSWNEYLNLSNVTTTGSLNSYFVNKQRAYLEVKFWNTPDAQAATGTGHLLLQQQITNFTGLTDTMDFPVEWLMYLRWALADDLSTGQPQTIMDRCSAKAEAYRVALENWDVEDAPTSFAPDSRAAYQTGGFR